MQRKRVLWSSWILNERNLSCKIVKNCRIIGLNREREQILSEVCMMKKGFIVLLTCWDVMRKSMFKGLVYMPPDSSPRFTCKVNLSNTKNPAWFFILASRLDRGMQHVNWLPPRTLVARVFLKIIFRGCPIINSLSNGAMLERLVNATLWYNSSAVLKANTIHE